MRSDEQQHLERMLMQQWKALPEEMMGRRKGSKKADGVGAAELPLDAVACEGDEAFVEEDFFCEACKKYFKSEQQMCDVPTSARAFFVAYTLCMQQHIASKKHKERQLEWEDLLLETHGDTGDVEEAAEEEAAPPVLDDSDEEFEAQLARMHVGGDEQCVSDEDSAGPKGPSAVAAAASGSDEEEETSLNFGKKKKKKKAKRGVMSDAALFDEAAAEDAAPSVPDDGSDDKDCDAPAHGKKLTKKQIRRWCNSVSVPVVLRYSQAGRRKRKNWRRRRRRQQPRPCGSQM